MRRAAVLLALLLPAAAPAQTHLVYTIPALSQFYWRAFDQELGDTVTVTSCGSGGVGAQRDVLRALDKSYLWFWSSTAGGRPTAPCDSHSVAGRGGDADSFALRGEGLYWVYVTNFLSSGRRGLGCLSNEVRVLPGILTGVPIGAPADSVTDCRIFAVTGAFVSTLPCAAWYVRPIAPDKLAEWTHRRLASGVYFMRCTARSGALVKRKVPVLR